MINYFEKGHSQQTKSYEVGGRKRSITLKTDEETEEEIDEKIGEISIKYPEWAIEYKIYRVKSKQ
jgi:hypothetical protein